MKIGILKTDAVRPEWVGRFGEYPAMFEQILLAEDPSLEFLQWDVEQGEIPENLGAVDGYIITGSKSSVYDDKPWIRDLEALVRDLNNGRHKLIGICFGHQVIAKALGGIVDKSPKGWGCGIQRYQLSDRALEADTAGSELSLIASHQDQVMTAPPGAVVIASSDHCNIAGFRVGGHILTFQGHPEFIPDYSREIMHFRREMIGESQVVAGLASLESEEHQGARVARWMLDFLAAD
jgi:GMP synthase-like glutamine amidotransferase